MRTWQKQADYGRFRIMIIIIKMMMMMIINENDEDNIIKKMIMIMPARGLCSPTLDIARRLMPLRRLRPRLSPGVKDILIIYLGSKIS